MTDITVRPGQKIVVYDGNKVELGEGHLLRRTPHPDLGLIAYECEEHTILARGEHWVRIGGELHRVCAPS